jgi:heat shock protein 5
MRRLAVVAGLALLSSVWAAEQKVEKPCIGIDLGTTYSVVGHWQNDKVEIIANEMGNRITPSVVGFTSDERLVGDAARNQVDINYKNTIYAVKRLMGRQYSDEHVQKDKKLLSYDVVSDNHGRAAVQVEFKGEKRTFKPEEVSAMILQKMKEIAEAFLNQKVTSAVVTVPAYFNDAQRQATKDAGTIAGLNIARILNEPTAAAIAYGLDKRDGEKKVLVFDLGGGTFDVSLLTIDNGVFEVEATNGDTHLGGEDFDNRIIDYLVKLVKKKHNKDLSNNQQALARLRKAAESAKRRLSSQPEARVEVDNIVEGFDLSERITRGKFEEICMDLFKGTLEPVKAVLNDAQLEKEDVDEVVLVGGSTRVPKIQSLIQEFFNGKEPNRGINPDEAIAYGAAVQAAVLSGEDLNQKVILVDVVPLSLGIETIGGVFLPIIERNSIVPTQKKQVVTTTSDMQETIDFQVYEGERAMTKDNRQLGKFTLAGIKKAPRGQAQVEVQMDVDENGILHVKATDLDGGSSESVEIQNDKNRLTQDEIERMVEEAAQMEEQDKATRERVQARVQLEQVAYDARTKARSDEYKAVMSEEDQTTVDEAASEVITWLDDNSEAGKEELEAKLQELQGRVRERLDAAKAKVAEGPKKDDEVAADSGAAAEEEPAEENVATEDDEEDDF